MAGSKPGFDGRMGLVEASWEAMRNPAQLDCVAPSAAPRRPAGRRRRRWGRARTVAAGGGVDGGRCGRRCAAAAGGGAAGQRAGSGGRCRLRRASRGPTVAGGAGRPPRFFFSSSLPSRRLLGGGAPVARRGSGNTSGLDRVGQATERNGFVEPRQNRSRGSGKQGMVRPAMPSEKQRMCAAGARGAKGGGRGAKNSGRAGAGMVGSRTRRRLLFPLRRPTSPLP